MPPRHSIYYRATARGCVERPALLGDRQVDVCVVGGGVAGCSAALHLAKRGLKVALLEAEQIGAGASGRSGGQILPGFACDQTKLEALLGSAPARRLWDLSVEAIDLVRALIKCASIDCDWRDGHLQAAIKPRQRAELEPWSEELHERYAYPHTRLLDKSELSGELGTDRYCAGLLDTHGGHLHPLNYTLGLAAAAERAGATLYEHSPVTALRAGAQTRVETATGAITAMHVLVAANTRVGDLLPTVRGRILPVRTYMIATEPLGEDRARELIAHDWAVADCNFVLDYFRRSADHRLLFGGRVSYSGRDYLDSGRATRRHMLRVFPQLNEARIDYAWDGWLDISMNRTPDFGRIDNIYYLQGFSGHGLALATLAGKVIAEAITMTSERFDVFGKLRHREFPGGAFLRAPTLALAMLWYRLRDWL